MTRFEITYDRCILGFQEYVKLNLLDKVDENTLRRKRLVPNVPWKECTPETLKMIIEYNSSLRVDFGWSFESSKHYKDMMDECIKEITPKFNTHVGNMMSDLTCSWLGFVPHNMYDKEIYRDLSNYGLIVFNNELIAFQIEVVKFLSKHISYRQHALLRDERYRFDFFKALRRDKKSLADAYYFYMQSIKDVGCIDKIPRDIVEEQIGCHYLHEPDLFFELLDFSILKGEVDE